MTQHYSPDRNYAARISINYTYRGHQLAVLENELLRISVLLSKGTDIVEYLYKPLDIDFMWRTPWGIRARDAMAATPTNPVATWLDHYPGGWQEILPNGGYVSEFKGAPLGLHAEVSGLPWDYAVEVDTPERVTLRTWVRATRTPLFLEKRLTLDRNSARLVVDEVLTNESPVEVPVMWGHHIALGEPFLGPDCRVDCGATRIHGHPDTFSPHSRLQAGQTGTWPWFPGAAGGQVDLRRIPGPDEPGGDACYLGDLTGGWYAVTDTRRRVGFAVTWPADVFRFLWYWQMYRGEPGYPWWGQTYNLGLEPFTSFPNQGLGAATDNGTALVLGPRETRHVTLSALVYTGAEGVAHVAPDGTVRVAGVENAGN